MYLFYYLDCCGVDFLLSINNLFPFLPLFLPTGSLVSQHAVKDEIEWMILSLTPTSGIVGLDHHARFIQWQGGIHGLVPGRQALYRLSFLFSGFLS